MAASVVHFTTVHPANDIRIYHKQCVSLANSGYDVTLVVANAGLDQVADIPVVSLPLPRGRIDRMTRLQWLCLCACLRLKAHVYHFHDPELIFVGLILKFFGKKVVYDVHEDVPLQIMSKDWIPKKLRSSISRTFNFIEKCSARCFDAVITATEPIARKFRHANRLTVTVNNFPIIANLDSQPSAYEKKDQVCYVGGLTEMRGITQIIEACGRIEMSLVLCGRFFCAQYESRLRATREWKYVDFRGYLAREQVYDVIRASKVGLVTLLPAINYLESQPTKLYEYMSQGTPVIASNFPFWRQIVEGEGCGLCVDPEDPKAIADAILYLKDHPEEAERMGQNGFRAVQRQFHWELEFKKLEELYAQLIN